MSDLLRNTQSGISPMAGDERPLSPIPNSADRPLPVYEKGSGTERREAAPERLPPRHLQETMARRDSIPAGVRQRCVYTFTATPI